MNTPQEFSSSRMKTRFRFDLVSMTFVALLSVFLVFSLAQWIANHKYTKIDEVIFFGIILLGVAGLLALRNWLGLSRFVERYDAVEPVPEITRVKQAQKRDVFGVVLAVGAAMVLGSSLIPGPLLSGLRSG
jgi:hypothetical protein